MRVTFDKSKFATITRAPELAKWLDKASKVTRTLAFDTETTGLDIFRDRLVGASFAYKNNEMIEACYVPLDHRTPYNLPLAQFAKVVGPHLTISDGSRVLHNAGYELAILHRYGLPITRVHDTMYMAYTLYGDTLKSLGMDYLAERFLGYRTIRFNEVVIVGRNDFRDVPVDEATLYAAEDTAVTLALAYVFAELMKQQGLSDVYKEDRKLIPVLHRMKQAGVKIDTKILSNLADRWGEELKEIEARAREIAGIDDLNLASSAQCIRVAEARGLDVPKNFQTKAPSLDKFALEVLAGDPFIDTLAEHRKIAKLRGTYAIGLPKKVEEHSKRVHPNFNACRTSTGRFASNEPSLQNLSTRTKEGKLIREAVVAEKGRLLVGADYSQIELRVAGALSKEPNLIEAYQKGIDVHTLTASKIRKVPLDQVTSEQRDPAKTTNFLALYGGGPFQLARSVKISYEEAEDFIIEYWATMPRLEEYIEEAKNRGRKKGYVETLFGRRVHVEEIRHRDAARRKSAERLCVSGEVQGTAADICRRAMVAVDGLLLDNPKWEANLIITCHDELIVECKDKYAEAVRDAVKSAMETVCVLPDVPVIADAKIGRNWKEVK